jgi:hypothetical protein
MRWLIAALSLAVIFSIFGSVGAFVVGKPTLKLLRGDRQVVSVETKPRKLALSDPGALPAP